MNFETAAKLLTEIGTEFNQESEYRGEGKERQEHKLPLFKSVKIPFTPAEWCATTMREGDHYLGGCCGNLSAVQDDWCGVHRDGGWIQTETLSGLAEGLLGTHDGFETWKEKPDEAVVLAKVDDFDNLSPWDKVELVWHLVREHYTPKVPEATWMKDPAKRSIRTLAQTFHRLDTHLLFRDLEKGDVEVSNYTRQKGSQRKARQLELLYRLIPSLNELQNNIRSLNPGQFEGWALWDNEANAVARNGFGECFYEHREDVDELFNLWRKSDSEHTGERYGRRQKPIDEMLSIRQVRITVEEGVVFYE